MNKLNSTNNITREQLQIANRAEKVFPNGCHRVLFVLPPESPEDNFDPELVLAKRYPSYPPYGSGILARKLKDRSYSPEIIDLNYQLFRMVHEDPENFKYKVWQEILAKKIEEFQPSMIAITMMFTIAHQSMVEIVRYLKTMYSSIPIIVGGVYISNDLEKILRSCPEIDFGMFYEGDVSFPDFLDVINGRLSTEHISQVGFLDQKEFISTKERATPNIAEQMTRPDYLDLPIGNYSDYGAVGAYNFLRGERKASTVLTNRGCRARCTFCSVREFNGLSVRSRNTEEVVDEIQFLYETYGITHIMWLDDDLFYNEKRAIELFNGIVKRGLKITWDATNGIIAAAIKPEILAAAAESGCIGMNLGLESGNPEILREIRKPGTVDNFRRAKNLLDEYPQIFVKGFLIIGFPEETIAQMADTVSLSSELAFHWYPLQILTPLPNTDITDSMLEQGLISEEEITPGFLGEAAGSKSKGGGSLRRREQEEEKKARHFENFFETRSDNDCLNAEELRDMWFIVDYKVNYEKLLHINNPIKVRNISMMLKQITDEYTQNNSLGNLFMAVLEQKLGNHDKSQRRLGLAEKYLSTSAYWQKRYDVLNINEVISQVKSRSFVDSELP